MTNVLVVGAGPAGLATAMTLARNSIECVVVEARVEASTLPRATVVSLRTMEFVRAWGLEAAVRAGGNDVEWRMSMSETLADAASGTTSAVGYPSAEQSAVMSPTSAACVPQDHLEGVLREYLCAQPGVRFEAGTEVRSIVAGPDGARVTLHDARSGDARVIDARYVVAADGAHSRVRTELGIPMIGTERLRDAIMVEFRAPLWDVVGAHRYGIYAVARPEPGTLLPAGVGDRWLYGFEWNPGNEQLAEYDDDRLQRRITLATGVPGLAPRIERVGAFSFAAQIAERFRQNDVFLVGDAAHRITPRGGTGMNTAFADGVDLGWKVAWVLQGWASPSLLETYEEERRPVAEHNLARSADPSGSLRDVVSELPVDLGGRIRHCWIGSSTQSSTLDLLGPGLTLFTGPHAGPWTRAAARVPVRVPVAVRHLDPVTCRAMGIPVHGALLVRPDGMPVASWSAPVDAARALHDELAFIGVATRHAA